MIQKSLLLLALLFVSAFSIPLNINLQIAIRDTNGRSQSISNEPFIFTFLGNNGVAFWTESKNITSPSGLINTLLGSITPINASQFYAQDSVKLVVLQGVDTVLADPFNSVAFSFKSGFSDSAVASSRLGGKTLAGVRTEIGDSTASIQSKIRFEIRDSINAHPSSSPVPIITDTAVSIRNSLRDTANAVRSSIRLEIRDSLTGSRLSTQTSLNDSLASVKGVLRGNIGDSAVIIRGFAVSTASDTATSLRTSLRKAISDSITAHPSANPASQIGDSLSSNRTALRANMGDSASNARNYAASQDNSVMTTLRTNIRDSIAAHPSLNPVSQIGDSLVANRTALRANMGDSATNVRTYAIARASDTAVTLRTYAQARVGDTATTVRSYGIARIHDSLTSHLNQDLKTTNTPTFNKLLLGTATDPGGWFTGNSGQIATNGTLFADGHILLPRTTGGNAVFHVYEKPASRFYFRGVPNVADGTGYKDLMIIDTTGGVTITGQVSTGDAAIKWKVLTGILPNASSMVVAHGVTGSKIISVQVSAYNGAWNYYVQSPGDFTSISDQIAYVSWSDTQISINYIGTAFRSQAYKIYVTYQN